MSFIRFHTTKNNSVRLKCPEDGFQADLHLATCLLWVLADMQTVKYFNLVGDEEDIGNERRDSSGVGLAHSAIIGMRLVLPLHTLQPYELICRYMAPLTS